MSTTDTVLLIILTSLMSLFFLLCITAIIIVLRLLASVKRAVATAEHVIDSVESATSVLKDASGPLAALKVIKNIVDTVHKHKK